MQKYYSEILGMPIFAQVEKKLVGEVRDLVVDPKNGRLLALVLQEGGLFRKTFIVASLDVAKINDQIEIAETKNVIPIEELPAADAVWKSKIKIIGTEVITLEKKLIGVATDYAIETTTLFMTKLVVGPTFGVPLAQKRIIPFENIQSISRDQIIISDDTLPSGAYAAKGA